MEPIKKKVAILWGLLLLMGWPQAVFCGEMETLMDEFGQAYEQLKPLPNSSVNADYKLSQTALGGLYTTKSLGLIHRQNQKIAAQNEVMLKKADRMIEQNNEIIRLLAIIAKEKNIQKTED